MKQICYSDHEIFERYHKFNLKAGFKSNRKVNLKELNQLEIGDYVTHIDHGIGIFGGLKKIDVNGKVQEAIKLTYGERDTLYVSIHLIHKISKYNGKDGTKPRIYKLGSGAWDKIKLKAKKRVKEVAFNLIEAYAKRKMKKDLYMAQIHQCNTNLKLLFYTRTLLIKLNQQQMLRVTWKVHNQWID